jgi:hypothetical protein
MPQSTPPAAQPAEPLDPAIEMARLQARLDELRARQFSQALHPVTFRGYGAGSQIDPEDKARVILTFPVDAGRSVRVSVLQGTACEFLDSLIETTGGDRALEHRREAARIATLKRGCRRGKASR